MEKIIDKNYDPKLLNPLTLAFVGDAVFDLMVRERLVFDHNAPVGVLNDLKVSTVCCKSQSRLIKKLLPDLTSEEVLVFKKGRNSHASNVPKKASAEEYRNATGLETLFGYIYLKGDINRLRELFELIMREI